MRANHRAPLALVATLLAPAAALAQNAAPPSTGLVRVEAQVFRIANRPYFTEYSARLSDRALPILREVADTLRAHPEIAHLTIEGHTDEVEQRTQGRRDVSLERAQAVRDWLVAQGIEPGRLEAVGMRSSRPRGPNDTRSQRTLNRRVEFRVQPAAAP